MFCTKCGTLINDGENFCTGCGARVEDIKKEADMPENIAAPAAPETSAEVLQDLPEQNADLSSIVESVLSGNEQDAPTPIIAPPAPSVPEEKPKKAKVKKEKAPKSPRAKSKNSVGIVCRILSVFVCLILFVVLLSTAFVGILKDAFTPQNISSCIENAGIDGILLDGDTISDIVYDNCSQDVLDELGLSRNDIDEIVKAVDFEDITNRLLMPYLNYLLGFTKAPPAMSGSVVTDIMNDNKKVISKVVDDDEIIEFVYSDETRGYVEALAQNFFDSITFDEISDEIEEGAEYARIFADKFFYIFMIILCVLLGLLVLLANKLRFFRALGDIGVVFIVAAVLLCLVYLAYLALPVAVTVPEYILSFFSPVELSLIIRIAAYAVFGIASCIACGIASSVAKKKSKA